MKLGISNDGLNRIARKTGQSNWRQRFDSPPQVQSNAVDAGELKKYVDYIMSLQPAESIQNLQSWVEYLNSELEAVKTDLQKQPVNTQDWAAAEEEFGGEQPAQQTQQQNYPTVWESVKDMFNW